MKRWEEPISTFSHSKKNPFHKPTLVCFTTFLNTCTIPHTKQQENPQSEPVFGYTFNICATLTGGSKMYVCMLKGQCHEVLTPFKKKNSTRAPYEQAKTVLQNKIFVKNVCPRSR